jgi:hypothetical protein
MMTLNRKAKRSQKRGRLDFALDEIVLRSFLQRLRGPRFVIKTGAYNERNARRNFVHFAYGA